MKFRTNSADSSAFRPSPLSTGCVIARRRRTLVRSSGLKAANVTLAIRTLWYSTWVLSLMLLAACVSFAQAVNIGDDVSRPIPGVGHDYIHLLDETVNPANGSLSIKIDLPTPKDRGFTLPFALTYNSGEVHRFTSTQEGVGGIDNNGNPVDLSQVGHGWSDTFPYMSVIQTQFSPDAGGEYTTYCTLNSSYNFYDPDGGSHMLNLAAIATQPAISSGTTGNAYCNGGHIANKGSYPVFHGVPVGGDDQFIGKMSAECNGDPNSTIGECLTGSPAVTVADRGGTSYIFSSGIVGQVVMGSPMTAALPEFRYPNLIEDRNGNTLRIIGGSNYQGNSILDSSGRTIVSSVWGQAPTGATVVPTSYTIGGLSYTISYTTTTASYTSSSVQVYPTDNAPSSLSCTPNFTVNDGAYPVIQTITLPNRQVYTFQYDPTWGLLSKITYPNGGWVQYTWGLSNTPSALATFDSASASTGIPGSAPLIIPHGCDYEYQTPVVLQRQVGYSSNSSAALTQTFAYATNWDQTVAPGTYSGGYTWDSKSTTVYTTDNISGKTAERVYTYTPVMKWPCGNCDPSSLPLQLPVESTVVDYDWGNTTTPVRQVTKTWADEFEMSSESTEWNNSSNLSSMTTYSYSGADSAENEPGYPGSLIQKSEYNFTGTLYRKTTYSYYPIAPACLYELNNSMSTTDCQNDSYSWVLSYKAVMPCQVITYDGTGNRITETDAYYDNNSTLCSGTSPGSPSAVSGLPASAHDETNYGPAAPAATPDSPYITRGNLTRLVKWSNVGPSQTTTLTYDETGQATAKTDACGNTVCADMAGSSHTTTYSYADNPSGGNAAGNSNAYLTQVIYPTQADGITQKVNFSYNYATGELANVTDENGNTTYYAYDDPLYRLTRTTYPDGGEVTISYNDSVPSITTSTLLNSSLLWRTNVSSMDGMGHEVITQLTSDPLGTDTVSVSYDGAGRVYTKTNPYRGSSPAANTTQTYYYDALGRPIETLEQDGNKLQWCYNGVVSTPAVANCSVLSGSVTGSVWVDSTDENGNHWQRASDAFGRLIEIMEPSGTVQSPIMETDYSYNALNDLTAVTQWGGSSGTSDSRARAFSYDSLSRLISTTNPETGTVTYTYDANSNVQTKIDARGVATTYGYDTLNRVQSKSYSDSSTPLSCYQYDASSVANGIGRLSAAWTQSASVGSCASTAPTTGFWTKSAILAYDAMGRVTSEQQSTLASVARSTVYSPAYTYDLAGNLLTSTDGTTPSPTSSGNLLTFTNTFDGAGRLATVTSNWVNTTHPASIFAAQTGTTTPCSSEASAAYAPFGGLQNAAFGGGVLTLNRLYDDRLRVSCEIDTGGINSPNTAGSATITITGTEQTK